MINKKYINQCMITVFVEDMEFYRYLNKQIIENYNHLTINNIVKEGISFKIKKDSNPCEFKEKVLLPIIKKFVKEKEEEIKDICEDKYEFTFDKDIVDIEFVDNVFTIEKCNKTLYVYSEL